MGALVNRACGFDPGESIEPLSEEWLLDVAELFRIKHPGASKPTSSGPPGFITGGVETE